MKLKQFWGLVSLLSEWFKWTKLLRKCAGKVVEKEETHSLLVGMQIDASSTISTEKLQKLKTNLPYDPAIPFLGIYSKSSTPFSANLFSTVPSQTFQNSLY